MISQLTEDSHILIIICTIYYSLMLTNGHNHILQWNINLGEKTRPITEQNNKMIYVYEKNHTWRLCGVSGGGG